MFGQITNITESVAAVSGQEVSSMGYGGLEELLAKAGDVLDRFFKGRHNGLCFEEGSCLFAFVSDYDEWDILISKKDKLVYTSKDKIYVSKDRADSVAVSPAHVLVLEKGKTVVIGKDNILVDSDE